MVGFGQSFKLYKNWAKFSRVFKSPVSLLNLSREVLGALDFQRPTFQSMKELKISKTFRLSLETVWKLLYCYLLSMA
jgi:hypothetical protein